MERYQLTLAYDGTDFKGFQRQGSKRTVQLEVEQALRILGWRERSILASGRTDTGVHAKGQVIAFDLDWRHSVQDLQKALNANLPSDVAITDCSKTVSSFHPRFSAKSRTYLYQILIGNVRQPLSERYAWRIDEKLNFNMLKKTAGKLLGPHDFRFVGRAMNEGGSTSRIVNSATWKRNADLIQFQICGNAFLYHMVRRLVFLQVRTASNRLTVEEYLEIINGKKDHCPGIAPARGLCLLKCEY